MRESPDQSGQQQAHEANARRPQGALFIWMNGHLAYPKALAAQLGRNDCPD